MGFWSGIKHALNSTLGTGDFKPLDKIVTDLIYNNKSLVASDNPYYIIEPNAKSISLNGSIQTLSYKLRFKNQGSIRISVGLKRSSSDVGTYLYVLVNNVQVANLSSNDTDYVTKTTDISIPAGGVLSFKVDGASSSSAKAYFKALEIHADVIDSSLFEDIT